MKSENIEFLTTKDIRELLKVSKRVLGNIMKSENPPPVLKIGREYRFNKLEFFKWIEKQKIL
jgi:hypothetical protein